MLARSRPPTGDLLGAYRAVAARPTGDSRGPALLLQTMRFGQPGG